jgi:hypothetical protein
MIFFKNHCRLPYNTSLGSLTQGRTPSALRGDILVMRVGINHNYVNMRERDTILSDWFMKRYAPFRPNLSRSLTFEIDFQHKF